MSLHARSVFSIAVVVRHCINLATGIANRTATTERTTLCPFRQLDRRAQRPCGDGGRERERERERERDRQTDRQTERETERETETETDRGSRGGGVHAVLRRLTSVKSACLLTSSHICNYQHIIVNMTLLTASQRQTYRIVIMPT